MNKESNDEEWIDIPEFEGYYQVSSFGNVKSLSRTVKHSSGNGVRSVKSAIKKSHVGNHGYPSITLCKSGKSYTKLVHKLMQQSFIEHFPQQLPYVDHINMIKIDNILINLRECSASNSQANKVKIKNASSIYKGVSWSKKYKKWLSYIKYNGKQYVLGTFVSEEDAGRTYDIEAIKYFKEFSNLNFNRSDYND